MKRFKVGMVLGKFYPFHNGHAYLIDSALSQCDFVYVYMCSLPTDYYHGMDRCAWIFEHYRNECFEHRLHIFHVNEVLPQYPEEHPDFWNIWVNVVKSRAEKPIDAIFTSEDYGTPFAIHLNVEHVKVDQQRLLVPTSGTACRGHIYEQWDFLPPEVQDHFRKKICIIGPESTGKSTLAHRLAEHYDASIIDEYGREYTDQHGTTNLTAADFVNIGYGQYLRELSAYPSARRVLFCDTDQLITRAFYRLYAKYGTVTFADDVDAYLAYLQESRRYDLYLLLTPDVPYVQDGTRDFPHIRDEAFDLIHKMVKQTNVPFIRIRGSDYEDRFEQAVFWTNTILDTAK